MKVVVSLAVAIACMLPSTSTAGASTTTRWGWSELEHHSVSEQQAPYKAMINVSGPQLPAGPNPPERPAIIRVLENGFFERRRS